MQLPEKMFLGTAIPSALIFMDMSRKDNDSILFIDASKLGESVSKTQKVLNAVDIKTLCDIYNLFRSDRKTDINKKGFCWVVKNDAVINNSSKLMPSIYTGVEEKVFDPKENKKQIDTLKLQLKEQMKLSNKIMQSLMRGLK